MTGKIAFILFDDSSPDLAIGSVGGTVRLGGLSEMAKWIGPIIKERGFKRLLAHNIGGNWPLYHYDPALPYQQNASNAVSKFNLAPHGGHVMWLNQFLLAEQATAPWANRQELSLFHNLLREDYGIEEVIYYLGGPQYVPEEIREASLEPFIGLKGASFGFDAVYLPEHFAECKQLFKWVKRENPTARIYTEGRPDLAVDPRRAKYQDGTIAHLDMDVALPDLLGNATEHWGEVITQVNNEGEEWAGNSPLITEWGWRENLP